MGVLPENLRREALGNGITALVTPEHTFGTDALLLARFSAEQAPRAARAADLCAGCGIVSLLWAREEFPRRIDALELQPEAAALAAAAAEENGLSGRIAVHPGDLREHLLPPGAYDLAACNPPYFRTGAGDAASSAARQTARAEETLTLPELCAEAARLLKTGGRFCLCHRTERMASVMAALTAAGLAPKVLQLVRTSPRREPKLFLLCAVKGGGEGLRLLPERELFPGQRLFGEASASERSL